MRMFLLGVLQVALLWAAVTSAYADDFPEAAIAWLKDRYAQAQPLTPGDWQKMLETQFVRRVPGNNYLLDEGTCNTSVADIVFWSRVPPIKGPPPTTCYSRFIKKFQSADMPEITHIWALSKREIHGDKLFFRGVCLVRGEATGNVVRDTRNFIGVLGVRCVNWDTGEVVRARFEMPITNPGYARDYAIEPVSNATEAR
jgi:hypothetical protein